MSQIAIPYANQVDSPVFGVQENPPSSINNQLQSSINTQISPSNSNEQYLVGDLSLNLLGMITPLLNQHNQWL
jgi:hypothetical protein